MAQREGQLRAAAGQAIYEVDHFYEQLQGRDKIVASDKMRGAQAIHPLQELGRMVTEIKEEVKDMMRDM